MGAFIDLTGQRFGRLMVVKHIGTRSKSALWKCLCDCGTETEVVYGSLISGYTKSCGCLHREIAKEMMTTHGMRGTKLYKVWNNMLQRSNNLNNKYYSDYGGRGITVCDEWREFLPFYNWAMTNGYLEGLSIDRINNDGNYESSNCKWSTMKEQSNNRRNTVWIEYQGDRKTLAQWADIYGISSACLYGRIKIGWAIDKALLTPIRIQKNNVKKDE